MDEQDTPIKKKTVAKPRLAFDSSDEEKKGESNNRNPITTSTSTTSLSTGSKRGIHHKIKICSFK
jgi:hypothetical protein